MAISLGPIASGLPKDLVQKLVEAEREPIRQLEVRKASEEAKLKLVQELTSKINDASAGLKDLTRYRQFRDLGSTVGRPELMDVSLDGNVAEPGNYSMEVIQLAGRSSMLSNGFPDPDETWAGAGYFSYELPNGDVREIYIENDESTLNGIAGIINNQKDLNLQAMVVDDGTGSENPYRLIVSHKGSGEVNDAEFPDFYFVDGDQDFYMDQERPALNSVLKVNGFEVEFAGNKIDSLIPGVTIDLKDAAPGKEFTLAIKEDLKSSEGKIKGLVEKVNAVLGFIQQQNKLDKDSDTKNTLGGDITLQNLEYKIRNLILTPRETEYGNVRLGDLGITFTRDGLLQIDEKKLGATLNGNFEGVAQFFTGITDTNDGFIGSLQATMSSLTKMNGMVFTRSDGIKKRIQDIDRQIENKERQVARSEQDLKAKFAKLESTMGELKAKQASVQSTLGGASLLPGLG